MNGFTDIHTHILPETDDGAQDISDARKLLSMAWEDGTRQIFLTPHYRGKFKSSPEQLQEKYKQLLELARQEFPEIKLHLGCEVAYETAAPEALLAGNILTLNNSRYVLLEFQPVSLRSQILSAVAEISRCGFIPIIAHVERYDITRKHPEMPRELVEMGALLQVNADSVLGRNGFSVKRLCHKMLKEELVHFIASDAHDQTRRTPLLQRCFLRIEKKYGPEYACALFFENAQAIIEDTVIY